MIKEGDTARLLETKTANGKTKFEYGKIGEIVKVVSVFYFPVLIVENKKGRFSITADKVSKIYNNDKNNIDRAPGNGCHN